MAALVNLHRCALKQSERQLWEASVIFRPTLNAHISTSHRYSKCITRKVKILVPLSLAASTRRAL